MLDPGIVVFAYDRPTHLERVLLHLSRNDIEHLYIFSDGPKNNEDKSSVESVRKVIAEIDWCEKTVICREKNLGLANSIISGLEYVFRDHDSVIVLEDDCVPSSSFLSYMYVCLEKYQHIPEVMNVNGYSPPIEIPGNYKNDIYFTYRNTSWGWATWESAWSKFKYNPMTVTELEENKSEIKRITRKAGRDLYPMLRAQLRGEIDSWAVWWSYAIACNNGLCVNSINSQTRNIGHDGTGTHSNNSDRYNVKVSSTPPVNLSFPNSVFVNEEINKRYNRFISGESSSKLREYAKRGAEILGILDMYRDFRSR